MDAILLQVVRENKQGSSYLAMSLYESSFIVQKTLLAHTNMDTRMIRVHCVQVEILSQRMYWVLRQGLMEGHAHDRGSQFYKIQNERSQ